MKQKVKMAPRMKEASEKCDGPVNQHKMLAMGCRIPEEGKMLSRPEGKKRK